MARDPRRRSAMAAGAVMLGLLTACTTGPGESEPIPTTPTAQEPTINPPPATTSPEVEAARAVEQAVTAYYAGTDDLLSDPQSSIDQATEIATGDELEEVRRLLQQERVDGRRQTGQAVVASLEVTEVDLTPPATANARVCLDVTGVDVVGPDGTSVVLPDREERSIVDLGLIEQEVTGWVVERTAAKGVPCDK